MAGIIIREVFITYVSVNSKPGPFPLGNFLKGRILHSAGTKKAQTPTLWAENSCGNHTPGEIIFKNPAKETQNIKQKLGNANMFRNIKTYRSPKLLAEWLLWIFKISQIILYSSINQHKKFITDKCQNTTLINNNCQKIQMTGYESRIP